MIPMHCGVYKQNEFPVATARAQDGSSTLALNSQRHPQTHPNEPGHPKISPRCPFKAAEHQVHLSITDVSDLDIQRCLHTGLDTDTADSDIPHAGQHPTAHGTISDADHCAHAPSAGEQSDPLLGAGDVYPCGKQTACGNDSLIASLTTHDDGKLLPEH